MGIEEVKDLIYDIYLDFENEISDFDYKGRELTQEEVDVSLNLLEQFMGKLDVKLDDKLEDAKNKIQRLEKFIDNCGYGKRELQELECLKYRLAVLESESE